MPGCRTVSWTRSDAPVCPGRLRPARRCTAATSTPRSAPGAGKPTTTAPAGQWERRTNTTDRQTQLIQQGAPTSDLIGRPEQPLGRESVSPLLGMLLWFPLLAGVGNYRLC